MGAIIIGTWGKLRTVVSNVGGSPFPPSDGAGNNREYLAGSAWFKSVEGNGLLRRRDFGSGNAVAFDENTTPPPPVFPDRFYAFFIDPYVDQLIGLTATTSSSSFTITADAFVDGGQEAGTGGTEPLTGIEHFTYVS
jgi:hypothetical protein